MGLFRTVTMCLGTCGSNPYEDIDDDMPRWMSGGEMLYTDEKSIVGAESYASPDETADYVVATIFSTGDHDSAVAALQRVRAQFESEGANGTVVETSAWWKTKVATRVFEGVFAAVRAMGLTKQGKQDADQGKQDALARFHNKQLAAMCVWVKETAPEIFAWSVDYMAEHKEEIAMAIACAAAVAVLWELSPWVLEALGFSFPGVRAGSVAAKLMKRYMGYVPEDSWMAFFQRLGATWGRK